MKLTSQIWTWCLERKVHLSAEHLPGKFNQIADQESRMLTDSSERKLSPAIFRNLMMQLGPCTVDLFASRLTAQLANYMNWKPDPGAVATDAQSQQWTHIRGYAFPPFSLIGRCLTKVRQERVSRLVLITPVWPTQPWFPVLRSMAIREPVIILPAQDLLVNHRGELHSLIVQGSLTLATWLVSGSP